MRPLRVVEMVQKIPGHWYLFKIQNGVLLMPWFTSENIDMAELATTYRTPDQGVSAKSNSNIVFNDYRKMTPQANGSNNTLTTQGSQTLRFDDLADTRAVL